MCRLLAFVAGCWLMVFVCCRARCSFLLFVSCSLLVVVGRRRVCVFLSVVVGWLFVVVCGLWLFVVRCSFVVVCYWR